MVRNHIAVGAGAFTIVVSWTVVIVLRVCFVVCGGMNWMGRKRISIFARAIFAAALLSAVSTMVELLFQNLVYTRASVTCMKEEGTK